MATASYTTTGDMIPDGAYDLVFSNSVIEHVGVFAEQLRMAREIKRIGRNYLVQTPNRWFPIEPHFLVPGWQFLPRDLRAMFPDALVLRERVAGLTKSLVVWGGAVAADRPDALAMPAHFRR